jgi:hypothetical protein
LCSSRPVTGWCCFCDSHLQDDATLIAITVRPTHTGGDLEDNSLSLLAFGLEGKAQ